MHRWCKVMNHILSTALIKSVHKVDKDADKESVFPVHKFDADDVGQQWSDWRDVQLNNGMMVESSKSVNTKLRITI